EGPERKFRLEGGRRPGADEEAPGNQRGELASPPYDRDESEQEERHGPRAEEVAGMAAVDQVCVAGRQLDPHHLRFSGRELRPYLRVGPHVGEVLLLWAVVQAVQQPLPVLDIESRIQQRPG